MATTPTSTKPLSIMPGSRVLKSPLSDDEIWKRLKQAGFDEESIKLKDKAALVSYIAKLEAEIYDHQHHMGLLILERKELTSKYEQLKASTESSDFLHKRDSAVHLSALAEARRREESLKKAVVVKEECIASLEKALREMRAECAETKVAADSKFAEAQRLIDEAQKKFTEAEAKVRAAESLQAEANRYNNIAERKLRDVEAREDDLRRRTLSFKSECDEKEKEMILERQLLSERHSVLQQEQERSLEAQASLNEREDLIFSRSLELNQLQKELEDTKMKIENEHRAILDEKTKLELIEATLTEREEALTKRETELNRKEQELASFQVKLSSKEYDEIQKVIADQEATLRTRKSDLEAELQVQRKSVENEIEMMRRAWELKEVDLKQREDQLLEREHELEVLSRALEEREKELGELSSVVEERDQRLRAAEKEFELNKTLLHKEKVEIDTTKQDLLKSLDSLENKRRQVDHAKERLEAMKSETDDISVLEVKLKEEIDLVRNLKTDLLAEADKLKAEKAKFEAEWELLDEKKEELQREAEYLADEKLAVSRCIKDEREKLRQEKKEMHQQYTRDLESLSREREEFMNKMAHEHAEWFSKMQQERADFLKDIEMQKRELDNLVEKRREEVESYLKEREKSFEEEKNNELQYINTLKDKAEKELEQVSFEMKRLHAERAEINLDRERRNREWAELNNCIEELKVQRDKLQKQRELLHADSVQINAQTEELKKLEDLKVASEDIAIVEMLKSDMEANQQKISALKNLKQQTLMQGDGFNSLKKIDANKISYGFDTPAAQKPAAVSPPSPAQSSWIRRCAELIFRHHPQEPQIESKDKPLVSDSRDVSAGLKLLTNDKPLGDNSERQKMRLSFDEPKVIVEVPPTAEDIGTSNFAYKFKEDVNGHRVGRRKRGGGNSTNNVDPLVDLRKNKKLRPEEPSTENPLNQSRVTSNQSDVLKAQQLLMSLNHTQEKTKDTHVEMVDKVIHVSEVTCEKADADKDILHYGSSVLGKTEETCKGNNGQVTDCC
ncbi:protein CROWDED NUCLEI 4 [Senna tora]|uniref:Protein CROWDED NUCLEI 4 n=1 Tax=Senna tora TaxID=362788 RepID=A0A834ST55_9FABA|nr:protein CROWDED NUCLEI 4 [Senna tora]